jgi:hypothetical protein
LLASPPSPVRSELGARRPLWPRAQSKSARALAPPLGARSSELARVCSERVCSCPLGAQSISAQSSRTFALPRRHACVHSSAAPSCLRPLIRAAPALACSRRLCRAAARARIHSYHVRLVGVSVNGARVVAVTPPMFARPADGSGDCVVDTLSRLGMKTDGIFPVPSRSVFYIFSSVFVFARSRFRICGSKK